MYQVDPLRSSVACVDDTLSSRIRTSLCSLRPMEQTGRVSSKVAPENGPWTISSLAVTTRPAG